MKIFRVKIWVGRHNSFKLFSRDTKLSNKFGKHAFLWATFWSGSTFFRGIRIQPKCRSGSRLKHFDPGGSESACLLFDLIHALTLLTAIIRIRIKAKTLPGSVCLPFGIIDALTLLKAFIPNASKFIKNPWDMYDLSVDIAKTDQVLCQVQHLVRGVARNLISSVRFKIVLWENEHKYSFISIRFSFGKCTCIVVFLTPYLFLSKLVASDSI